MKRFAAVLLTGALLTGCAAPAPAPTSTQTFSECTAEVFDLLKKERGVQYLIDEKEAANILVSKLCGSLYK